MKKLILFILLLLALPIVSTAAEDHTYQEPADAIRLLADAEPVPAFTINAKGTIGILSYYRAYEDIKSLSETELRLAGLRINPVTNISSRKRYYYEYKILDIESNEIHDVKGFPKNARVSNIKWSPNQEYIAFTNTVDDGVELWVLSLDSRKAKRLTKPILNANFGNPIRWMADGKSILVTVLPRDRQPLIDTLNTVPRGPVISTNDGGVKAQNRTYQDLLKTPADAANFKQLARSEIWSVSLRGRKKLWKEASLISRINISPDGSFVLVAEIEEPFSYLVPYSRFPTTMNIYDAQGKFVKAQLKVPLIEELPKGFMAVRKGPRSLRWRTDQPATLYWVEALDQGDPEIDVPFRDAVFESEAPFTADKKLLIKTKDRFNRIIWGNNDVAVLTDYWRNSRNLRTLIFNPSDSTVEPVIFNERNYQDRYSDPGQFVTMKNELNRNSLRIDNNELLLKSRGYSSQGVYPFIDRYNLLSNKTERLYQASDLEKLETLIGFVGTSGDTVLTQLEAKNQVPNYFIRDIKNDVLKQVTNFNNPFESLQNVHKEIITYKRNDGLDLSATLYLPSGYDRKSTEKLPMLMWAYPREYKDKNSAGQVTSSPNRFTRPNYGSPVFWVNRGYIVLDRVAFPVVGEGDQEPNDTFRDQLVANAKAAITAVDQLGYVDTKRVAIGGHSYGAFMVANLLSHSDLFAAGIARSGAYNRTLTPFGFQAEERDYWESPETYYSMSPFMHADKMTTPLLLIHGDADNNSGTYPMQSERYFNALKGLGATTRLVMLPKESHGYRARESIMHMLWEQDNWLEQHVKNKVEN